MPVDWHPIVRAPWLREIPPSARPGMRVPARVFADDTLWRQVASDRSLEQLTNVAMLPGVLDCVYAMPDAHEGYGFPVGGVAAFAVDGGVISPGGVGYDINCGVRLLRSDLMAGDVAARIPAVAHDLARSIPSGTGRGGALLLGDDELERVLAHGCRYLAERGLATRADLEVTESGGCLPDADPAQVSLRARRRGQDQLGTLGSGNHFVEVDVVDEVLDAAAADAFGLRAGQVCVLIHTGSRGLGHQVCTDFVRELAGATTAHGIVLPDRQLACAPFQSREGRRYFGAMCAAANFAWANRQGITHQARAVFRRAFGPGESLPLVYDVAHNIAKVELVGGRPACVHRKGATRAFGPAQAEVPAAYQGVGQPVFIPGSMGTASYVLAGTDAAAAGSLNSTCHGAGRAMSRGAAKRATSGGRVRQELADRGITVCCASSGELAEEAPLAYKDVHRVVDVVRQAGIARVVARLRPLAVVKG